MSDLPEVRRADCGHGFLSVDSPPAARFQNGIHEQPVYLCDDCRARLQPKVEVKVVEPEVKKPQVETKAMQQPEPPKATQTPFEDGVQAARSGKTQIDNPYDGRTKDGRDWQRGFRAKWR